MTRVFHRVAQEADPVGIRLGKMDGPKSFAALGSYVAAKNAWG